MAGWCLWYRDIEKHTNHRISGSVTTPVDFTQGSTSVSDDPDAKRVIVIEYGQVEARNYAIYFGNELLAAKERFTKHMNERSEFEIEREGWAATISTVSVTDELHICGSFVLDVEDLSQKLMAEYINKQ